MGSDETISVDVRIVAATNRDLAEEIRAGRFREDLYYRLNVVSIMVPSLAERREDIPLLAQHFLHIHGERNRKDVKGFTPLAMDMLLRYDWPGNVRELENAVERAVVLLFGQYVSERELPQAVAEAVRTNPERWKMWSGISSSEQSGNAATIKAKRPNVWGSRARRCIPSSRATACLQGTRNSGPVMV